MSKRKDTYGRVQENQAQASCYSPPGESHEQHLILSATVCDNRYIVLQNRDTLTQALIAAVSIGGQLCRNIMPSNWPQLLRPQLAPRSNWYGTAPNPRHTQTGIYQNPTVDINYLVWTQNSSIQKYFLQTGQSKGLEVSPRNWPRVSPKDVWNVQGLGNPDLPSCQLLYTLDIWFFKLSSLDTDSGFSGRNIDQKTQSQAQRNHTSFKSKSFFSIWLENTNDSKANLEVMW